MAVGGAELAPLDFMRVIEEVGELMGYLLMFMATVEIILQMRGNSES